MLELELLAALVIPAVLGSPAAFQAVEPATTGETAALRIERKLYEQRLRTIQTELEGDDLPPWAGKYAHWSFEEECRVYIAPKSGVTWVDMNVWNHGDIVSVEPDRIRVSWRRPALTPPVGPPVEPPHRDGYPNHPVSGDLIPVSCGVDRFLIPEPKMVEFCNMWNSKELLFFQQFFDKLARLGVPASKPLVPEQYRQYLLDKPLFCTVVTIVMVEQRDGSTDGQRTIACIAEVDRGTLDGLLNDMTLYRASMWDNARVTEAAEHTARIRFVYPEEPSVYTRVAIGCRFSTESPHPYAPSQK